MSEAAICFWIRTDETLPCNRCATLIFEGDRRRRVVDIFDSPTHHMFQSIENSAVLGFLVFGTMLAPPWGGKDMLKISIIENEARRQLVLEGKLIAPWTDELKRVCQGATKDLNHCELVIDLRGLTVISADGEEALLDLMVHGAKFRGSDVFTKQLLKQLARRAQRKIQATTA